MPLTINVIVATRNKLTFIRNYKKARPIVILHVIKPKFHIVFSEKSYITSKIIMIIYYKSRDNVNWRLKRNFS